MDLKRSLIVVHRWLGVPLCALFLIWFASGIGMMYWDFPSVTAADRLARSASLDAASVRVTPETALATLAGTQTPTSIRLNTFDGRPAYRLRLGRGEDAIVYADTGEREGAGSRALADRAAAAWTRQPIASARVEPVTDVDQWTVQGPLRALRPLWKYSWPNGDQVYVAERSGEVVQYTTTASRIGAYLGPIPHWLYFTPLRAHQIAWSRTVIWTSAIGTVAAMLGIVIGVWMYSPSKRYRSAGVPSSLPYRGQKRWHAALGLIFGISAATWAFSGMLSMDPFPAIAGSAGRAARDGLSQALREPVKASAFATLSPRDALSQLKTEAVKELEFAVVAGEPVYIATLANGDIRVVPMSGEPRSEIDRARIAEAIARVSGAAKVERLEHYDRYYLDRRGQRPLPVLLVKLHDAQDTRYYIDPKAARVVGTYHTGNWMNRWLYHGLHSLDFPWLYNHRPAWDIVVVTFMLGGAALSVTSIVLAYRVLFRRASAAGRSE